MGSSFVPPDVQAEFDTSLEADVEIWMNAIREHIQELPDGEAAKVVKSFTEAWIGVDLDGTLAYHVTGDESMGFIGDPIPAMVERVKQWLSEGKQVRIFTARVCEDFTGEIKRRIQAWCMEHIGAVLPVTNQKDYNMVELWDDRAVQVITNTGEVVQKHKHATLRKRTLPVVQAEAAIAQACAKFLKKTRDRLAAKVRGYGKASKIAQPELAFMEGSSPGIPVWLLKFNENHDEHGRFAESDAAGRELFHGTTEKAAQAILSDGLKVSHSQSRNQIYAIANRDTALGYAQLGGTKAEDEVLALVVVEEGAFKYDNWSNRISKKDIPPEMIRRVEFYKRSQLGGVNENVKPYKVVAREPAKAQKSEVGEVFVLINQTQIEHLAGLEKLHKADTPNPHQLLNELLLIDWTPLLEEIEPYMEELAEHGALQALTGLNVTNADVISGVNEAAANWAAQRAAELVGMKRLPSGKLVENPDAKWAISETTRDDISELVMNAFEARTSIEELASQIQEAGTFSESRAMMIARTEGRRASTQGNLEGWKGSGVVSGVELLLSEDHDANSPCDCSDIAEGGPYPLDDPPDCPVHPNCNCILSPVLAEDEDVAA